jgi:hypothetical protein
VPAASASQLPLRAHVFDYRRRARIALALRRRATSLRRGPRRVIVTAPSTNVAPSRLRGLQTFLLPRISPRPAVAMPGLGFKFYSGLIDECLFARRPCSTWSGWFWAKLPQWSARPFSSYHHRQTFSSPPAMSSSTVHASDGERKLAGSPTLLTQDQGEIEIIPTAAGCSGHLSPVQSRPTA